MGILLVCANALFTRGVCINVAVYHCVNSDVNTNVDNSSRPNFCITIDATILRKRTRFLLFERGRKIHVSKPLGHFGNLSILMLILYASSSKINLEIKKKPINFYEKYGVKHKRIVLKITK